MRNKLLEAIKPLQLNTNDKNKLVNTIIDIGNSGSDGGVASQYAPRYFKIDWDKASEDWKYVLSLDNSAKNLIFIISSSNKVNFEGYIHILAYPMTIDYVKNIIAFSYLPVAANIPNFHPQLTGIIDFNTLIEIVPNLLKIEAGLDVNITMEGITEITEEEFYKID